MIQASSSTLAERYQQGIRLRRKASRQKHADLRGPGERDAVAILARGDRARVPELILEHVSVGLNREDSQRLANE